MCIWRCLARGSQARQDVRLARDRVPNIAPIGNICNRGPASTAFLTRAPQDRSVPVDLSGMAETPLTPFRLHTDHDLTMAALGRVTDTTSRSELLAAVPERPVRVATGVRVVSMDDFRARRAARVDAARSRSMSAHPTAAFATDEPQPA